MPVSPAAERECLLQVQEPGHWPCCGLHWLWGVLGLGGASCVGLCPLLLVGRRLVLDPLNTHTQTNKSIRLSVRQPDVYRGITKVAHSKHFRLDQTGTSISNRSRTFCFYSSEFFLSLAL